MNGCNPTPKSKPHKVADERLTERRGLAAAHAGGAQRRGTAYVLFLGTMMLVTIIGLSSVAVMRLKRHESAQLNDGTTARLLAQAAVEQGALSILRTAGWRDTLAYDTWTSLKAVGDGTLRWKIVDPENGDLVTDRNAPVRVHGEGTCGVATWVFSALVQAPMELQPVTLLTNGDLETGAESPWWGFSCSSSVVTASGFYHGGGAALRVWGRSSPISTLNQTLPQQFECATMAQCSAWIRTDASSEPAELSVWIQTTTGLEQIIFATSDVSSTWTLLSGSSEISYSGTFIDATVSVRLTSSFNDFYLDDAKCAVVSGHAGIVSGSWLREPSP